MIYADYNGSSPLLPSVKDYLRKRLDSDLYANPNAIHSMGQRISQGIEKCRGIISQVLGCFPDQIIFNSGASEGVSTIIRSVLDYSAGHKKIIITSPIEHAVIHSALSFYAEKGFTILQAGIDQGGKVKLSEVEKLLQDHQGKVALVTIMAANNETGVIQPYQDIARLCQKAGVDYFSDTTQLIGKGDFNFETSGLDYAVCSGHKIGALTGSGFILVKEPTKIRPLIFGAHQEQGLRGGTQHYLGVETLAIALKDFDQHKINLSELKKARLSFEKSLKDQFPQTVIIGDKSERLAGTTLISYPGIHGQAVQIELESRDIFVTTSAACSDNEPETSQVLKAMGIDDQIGRGVVRISLSYTQSAKEYALLAQGLKESYNKLHQIKSY
jgi:cysteine desulfurase